MRSFRSKPVGWRYESHKHALAAKGISTKTRFDYFALQDVAVGQSVVFNNRKGYHVVAVDGDLAQIELEGAWSGAAFWVPKEKLS